MKRTRRGLEGWTTYFNEILCPSLFSRPRPASDAREATSPLNGLTAASITDSSERKPELGG